MKPSSAFASPVSPALEAAVDQASLDKLQDRSGFDAIIVGAGAAGGMAAMRLTQAGLKVLALDAAWPAQSWRNRLRLPAGGAVSGHPFAWLRPRRRDGDRQYVRLGEQDFWPDDGLSPRWPLQRGELDRWYGVAEALLDLPAGKAGARPPAPEAWAAEAAQRIRERWPGAHAVPGRSASPPKALEAAAATGRLLVRQGAVVQDVEVDGAGRVRGARWFDRAIGGLCRAKAPLVFLCAPTLESTRILMASGSSASPGGLGARSGALGRYLMDPVVVSGEGGGALPSEPAEGGDDRRLWLPRFDLRSGQMEGGRGYGVQVRRVPHGRGRLRLELAAFAEMTPRAENRTTLDPNRSDAWGASLLRTACRHSEAELALAKDQAAALIELADALGARLRRPNFTPLPPGSSRHVCGAARMGSSPDDSVLDPNNQVWDATGLYVTGAAAFPAQGAQDPGLTVLALTARACDHAAHARGVVPTRPFRAERMPARA